VAVRREVLGGERTGTGPATGAAGQLTRARLQPAPPAKAVVAEAAAAAAMAAAGPRDARWPSTISSRSYEKESDRRSGGVWQAKCHAQAVLPPSATSTATITDIMDIMDGVPRMDGVGDHNGWGSDVAGDG
jgi:hypothetical protein